MLRGTGEATDVCPGLRALADSSSSSIRLFHLQWKSQEKVTTFIKNLAAFSHSVSFLTLHFMSWRQLKSSDAIRQPLLA